MDLSVVIPVYNEVESIDHLCQRLHEVLSVENHSYEVILVDDGSSDGTWPRMVELSKQYPHFVLVRFRRNFGQTAAMSAGMETAQGTVIVTLDADLQNPPEEIPKLLELMTDDVDVVSGWRKNRQDKFKRRLVSQTANRVISKITGVKLHDYGCSLKAYRGEVMKDVHLYGEMHRFIPALAHWVGGRVIECEVDHAARAHGESKYPPLGRTPRVILDLLTVKFLLRYSTGPIQIFGKIGSWFLVPGLLIFFAMVGLNITGTILDSNHAAFLLIKRPAWLISTFMLIFFGVQFISMGLLAEIQIRTYFESQGRKTYTIREVVRSDDDGPEREE